MEHNKQLDGLIGPEESQRILGALQRGASRRDVLAMMMAGGMQAALAGSIASVAGTAHAQTPRRGGRIKVAGGTAAVSDTLDPAKGSNHTDYIRACMFYNGLTSLDGSSDAAARAGRGVQQQRCEGLGLQAAQGRGVP